MKSTAFCYFSIMIFIFLSSCKDEVKDMQDNQTVLADTIPKQTAPDFMFVTAVSGLTLREHPNLQSEKLKLCLLAQK